MESSSVWYNIYRYLSEERSFNVILSNPVKTRAIASAKIKTDKLDAVKLADLLRGGYISECYVPNNKIMDLRELVRHRLVLVRMKTKLKNSIHGIMLMKGIQVSNACTHTFTLQYMEKLKELNDYRINHYISLIESLEQEIKDVSTKIILLAKENKMAKLLKTIPGIGYYSALFLVYFSLALKKYPNIYFIPVEYFLNNQIIVFEYYCRPDNEIQWSVFEKFDLNAEGLISILWRGGAIEALICQFCCEIELL